MRNDSDLIKKNGISNWWKQDLLFHNGIEALTIYLEKK